MLPVAEATVNLLVAMSKSPSIPVAPVTAKVPATTVLPVPEATVNLLVATLKSPAESKVPFTSVLPLAAVTENFVAALPSLIVKLALFNVVAPETPKVPPRVVAFEPLTVNVLLSVVAPVTPNVPATEVFPFDAVTTNLLVLTLKSPVALKVPDIAVLPLAAVITKVSEEPSFIDKLPLFIVVFPLTPSVEPTVTALVTPKLDSVDTPVTPKVPATEVLPVAEATVNLLVLMSKSPSIPVAPVTAKVPATTVLPVADATENLLVAIVRSPLKV